MKTKYISPRTQTITFLPEGVIAEWVTGQTLKTHTDSSDGTIDSASEYLSGEKEMSNSSWDGLGD